MMHRIGRLVLRALGVRTDEPEAPSEAARRSIEAMRARLDRLRSCAAAAAANEYRVRRCLETERQKLAELTDAQQTEACQARVSQIEEQLQSAQAQSDEARRQIQTFREELRQASERMRDAQLRSQLSTMRSQAEKLAMDSRFEEGLAAIEQMEYRANEASAEARALAELNEALRGENPCPKEGDGDERQ